MGIAVLAARLDRHALDFRLNKGIINPDGEMLLGLTFPLKKKIQGRLILSQQSWRFGQGDILAGFNPRMMGGNGRMPAAVRNRNQGNDAQIQVLHDTEKVWDIASDIPLEGGLIESLTFNLNYHRLQHNRWSGRSNNRPYSIVNEKPSDPKFELQVKNQFTSQFVPLSSIIDEEGEIINPGRYVDKLNGIITVQLFGSPNHDTFVAKNAFNIEMMINFGSETSGKFLDRMVDTVSERL